MSAALRISFILLGTALYCWTGVGAKDIYVSQTATGSDTGLDVANAHSLLWLNTAANWLPSPIAVSPGDTIHLVGVFTNALTLLGSGTSGNPITILFEVNAKFSMPVLPSSGAIAAIGRSWVVIDGGTNGLMECTNNGTTLGQQANTTAISASGMWHFTVQNLTITNLYRRTPHSVTDGNRFGVGISIDGSSITVQNCNLNEGDTMIAYNYGTGVQSNLTISGNSVGRCNHGITVGAYQPNPNLRDVTICSNRIDNLDVWDGNSGLHLDGMIIFNESPGFGGSISNLNIFANNIGPNIGITNTAAIFIDTYVPSQIVQMRIYNNLLSAVPPYSWSNGYMSIGGCTNSIIANNTMVSSSSSGVGITLTTVDVGITNNLFYSVGTPISVGSASSWPPTLASDYNIFWAGRWDGSGAFYFPNYAAANITLWRGRGFDAHSVTNQPTLDTNYVPTLADRVTKGGVNLYSYFSNDMNGVARGPLGPWTVGAFQNARVRGGSALRVRVSGP